jgi:hypothetical protein
MLTLRPAKERFHTDIGWLDSHHTFSFGEHYHPKHMGFRSLRVINDDRVAAGGGFGTHPHRDMEIISYVLEGALSHKDSMGTGSVIKPGDVQRMTAGTGVAHSEFNPSKSEGVHFLQIWIQPAKAGIEPSYEQKSFSTAERQGALRLVASPDGSAGSVKVHQDVKLYATLLAPGEAVTHTVAPRRHAWVHVARGAVTLNGQALGEGDGASTSDAGPLAIAATAGAEVLVFDLA